MSANKSRSLKRARSKSPEVEEAEKPKTTEVKQSTSTCSLPSCPRVAAYNYRKYHTPILCATHKKAGMVCLRYQRPQCEESECMVQPRYNYPGEKSGVKCASHKQFGMVDVVNKHCLVKGCYTQIRNASKYCAKHAWAELRKMEEEDTKRNYKDNGVSAAAAADDDTESDS